MNFNKVIIGGNLTRDPESKFFGDGKSVCNFGVAVNRAYKTREGERGEETTFVDVECWGRTAELVTQYLSKGRQVLIEGRLKADQWEDKQTGQKRSKLKVSAESVQFLGPKIDQHNGGSVAQPERPQAPPAGGGSYDDSEPPFMRLSEFG